MKEVWLGDCYPCEFYDHLPNELGDPLRQITEWTQEDLDAVQRFLESKGIIVRRPKFGAIDCYVDSCDRLPRPPITPRDHYLTLGQKLYSLHSHSIYPKDPWQAVMDQYKTLGHAVESPLHHPINCLCPPSLVRLGRDLYLDRDSHPDVWGFVCEWMIETAVEYRINICNTQGHSDGVFCPVAPGVLVTSHYKYDYEQSFPGWEVFRLPPELNNFTQAKNWWTPDDHINHNHAFSQHILKQAKDWIGDSRETVYEVNMLVIDEQNVIAMKEYAPLDKWLADRGITVHYFDFRTRSFWDGGWHCLTLDVWREDHKTDLFPQRGSNGVYWRLD